MSNSFVPGTGVVKVDLVFSLNGQKVMNGLHFVSELPVVASQFVILAGDVVAWYNTYLKPILPVTAGLEMVKVTDMGSQTGVQIQYTTGLPSMGTHNSPSLPGNVTAAVKFTTDKRGKSYTGRNFFPAFAQSDIVNGIVDAGVAAGIKAAYEALLTQTWSSDYVWVVASKIAGGILRSALETTQVMGVGIDTQVDSQKRRLAGRGR